MRMALMMVPSGSFTFPNQASAGDGTNHHSLLPNSVTFHHRGGKGDGEEEEPISISVSLINGCNLGKHVQRLRCRQSLTDQRDQIVWLGHLHEEQINIDLLARLLKGNRKGS